LIVTLGSISEISVSDPNSEVVMKLNTSRLTLIADIVMSVHVQS